MDYGVSVKFVGWMLGCLCLMWWLWMRGFIILRCRFCF